MLDVTRGRLEPYVAPAPVPVPSWFLDWADALGGLRIVDEDLIEIVPWHVRREQIAALLARSDSGYYTSFAKMQIRQPQPESASHKLPLPPFER